MQQNTKPDFQTMLIQAISEPGKISAAYTTFHNYSLGNAWLAMFECAMRKIDIGPINTYKGWQALGRQVRKGEKAISLIMPVTCKVAANENDDSENSDGHTFTRFILRPQWFVISQTDGPDVELPALPEWNTVTALETLKVTQVAFTHFDGNTQGYASPGRKIAVNPVAALPHKTLFHELAHVLLGHCEEGQLSDSERTPKNLREVEAESVAYLVTASLGLDGLEYSRGYLQHWLQSSEIPAKSSQKIFTIANQILKAGYPQTA